MHEALLDDGVKISLDTPKSIPSHSGDVDHVLQNSEQVDMSVLDLVDKIPFHSWGGAINTARLSLIDGIRMANYSTLCAICRRFLVMDTKYWNDLRERNFDGISIALEERLTVLGYKIKAWEVRHYIANESKKRLYIPTDIEKKSIV